jgi:hypothetical protein
MVRFRLVLSTKEISVLQVYYISFTIKIVVQDSKLCKISNVAYALYFLNNGNFPEGWQDYICNKSLIVLVVYSKQPEPFCTFDTKGIELLLEQQELALISRGQQETTR